MGIVGSRFVGNEQAVLYELRIIYDYCHNTVQYKNSNNYLRFAYSEALIAELDRRLGRCAFCAYRLQAVILIPFSG